MPNILVGGRKFRTYPRHLNRDRRIAISAAIRKRQAVVLDESARREIEDEFKQGEPLCFLFSSFFFLLKFAFPVRLSKRVAHSN
jgi:hypothetical protein